MKKQKSCQRWLRSVGLFFASLGVCSILGLGSPLALSGEAQIVVADVADVVSGDLSDVITEPDSTGQLDSWLLLGLERYHQGDLLGAVEAWQQSLVALLQAGAASVASADSVDLNSVDLASVDLDSARQSVEVLKYLARAQRQLGQASEAMASLDRLSSYYRQTNNLQQLGRILTEQAQVYGDLGQPQQAIALLCGDDAVLSSCQGRGAIFLSRQQADRLGEAAALGALGQTYYLQGEYSAAIEVLQIGLDIARAAGHKAYQMAALDTLGHVYESLGQRNSRYAQFARQAEDVAAIARLEQAARAAYRSALQYFTQGLEFAERQANPTALLRAQLNLILPSYYQAGKSAEAIASMLSAAQQQLGQLPDTREKAYSAIRLADLWGQTRARSVAYSGSFGEAPSGFAPSGFAPSGFVPFRFAQCSPRDDARDGATVALLQQAQAVARRIRDPVAESFAVGWLGHLSECAADYSAAQQLTARAQLLAARPEIEYLWTWQAGRILKARGRSDEAIAVYQQAVDMLSRVQGDIAIAHRDLRLDFRDAVEAIYRQLTVLQLAQAKHVEPVSQPALLSALRALDGLRLAELRNYLGSECDLPLAVAPRQATDPTTATLSTLISHDRLTVVLALPAESGQLQTILHEVPVGKRALVKQVNDFRDRLERRSDRTDSFLAGSQQFYDWLVRPFAPVLAARHIQTLAFNHDGILRSIPMAALHDGQQFLVQTYAVTNSLSFAEAAPPPPLAGPLKVLAFGLSEPARVSAAAMFPPLAAVEREIGQIAAAIPGSVTFLNEAFTQQRLQAELAAAPIAVLHLATHAQFSYDSRETFLVTGERDSANQYNRPLRLNELYRLLRQVRQAGSQANRPANRQNASNALQMLTLTACETAAGSEREALGLAGVAVQAGVNSAVASLWQVEDLAAADLATSFYAHLQAGEPRSLALQATQRDWLATRDSRYRHPGYWAALVLIEGSV